MNYYSQKAKKFLDLNWEKELYNDDELTHPEIYKMLGFPKHRTMLRMSNRNFGMTVQRFFLHCRTAEIKDELAKPENKEVRIREIMNKLGYPYRNRFNRTFRLVADLTPVEFRYFYIHFKDITGQSLTEYKKPDFDRYQPPRGKPTFISNFLNRCYKKFLHHEEISKK